MTGATSTTVYLIVVVLVAVGLGMVGVAVWLVRATRRDHVVLGPLERMGDRSWRKHDPDRRRDELDQVRPVGAPVIEPPPPEGAGKLEAVASEVDEAEHDVDTEPAPPNANDAPAVAGGESAVPNANDAPAVAGGESAVPNANDAPAVAGDEPAAEGPEPERDSTPTRTPDQFVARSDADAGK